MAEKYIITKADILVYRPTAVLDDDRIKPYILEAQNMDLKPVLNDVLFLDFMKNYDNVDTAYDKYRDLLNGKEYTYEGQTIKCDGIKPMLCYYALARFIVNNPLNVTRMGIVVKATQQSEPADPAMIRAVVNDLKSIGVTYQHQIEKFLQYNTATYTLYPYGESSNSNRKSGFKIFKL